MSVASTFGLILGAVILAVGLALVLLPLNFQSAEPTAMNQFQHSNGAAILRIQVPYANFSLGGASLTVQWTTATSTPVTGFLYPLTEGEVVWSGGPASTPPLDEVIQPQSAGTLTGSDLHPGNWYAVLLFESSSENANVSVTWSGSMFLPYAELGIPLTAAGGVFLVGTVALSRPRPAEEEPSSTYNYDAGGTAYVNPPLLAPEPTPVLASPVPRAALPAPSYSRAEATYPSSSTSGSSIVLPPDEAPAPRRTWRATPISRPGMGGGASGYPADRVGPRQRTRENEKGPTSGGGPAESSSSWSPAASPFPSPGLGICARCRLEIGDESWVFCPRCRNPLE